LAARIRAASGKGGRTGWVVRRRTRRRAPAGITGGAPGDGASGFRRAGQHGRGGEIGLRQGMAGEAEAAMGFGRGQFLPTRPQMHGAIPIRGTDDRRHPRIAGMGKAKRWRQYGLHQEQCRNQAREEGGGAFHEHMLNLVASGCQGGLRDVAATNAGSGERA
jgi:hypothetical protein